MADRAMMFNAEMVEALLAARKTQTRRVGERQPAEVGDVIRVREAHCITQAGAWDAECVVNPEDASQACYYRAGWKGEGRIRWRPGMYMPRWASRIFLEVTSVRQERLHDITEEDARQEGVGVREGQSAVGAFEELWRSVYSSGGKEWEANPMVWRVEFRAAR